MKRTKPVEQSGDYLFNVLRRFKVLSRNKEVELAKKIERGDEVARETLILHNLRLVVSIAKKLPKKGVPLSDTIQVGILGLMRAVERFDWRREVRFSTYAAWWIRQAILRENPRLQKMVCVPTYQEGRIREYMRRREEADATGEAEKSDREIQGEMELTEKRRELLARALQASTPPMDIDGPLPTFSSRRGETDITLGEVIPDEGAKTEKDLIEAMAKEERVDGILNLKVLTRKERAVLQVLYGISDGEPKTLRETSGHFGVSRERIRQIEADALKKIRKKLGVPDPTDKKRRRP